MQLAFSESDGIKIVVLQGRMDIVGTQQIEMRFTALIASETANIILDLAGVEFMASIGIGIIVRAADALLKRKGKIALLNPQFHILQVLQSTRITEIIPVYYDLPAAMAYFKQTANN